MTVDSQPGSRADAPRPAADLVRRERILAAVRFLVSALVAVALCLLGWLRVPRHLTGPIDIVGYPAFADFAYDRPIWAYRLTVFAFPAIMIVTYVLLAWRGPLRRRAAPAPAAPTVAAPDSASVASAGATGLRDVPGVLTRLAIPAALVGIVVASRTGHVDLTAFVAVLVYLAAVVGGATCWAWLVGRRNGRQPSVAFWPVLALANGAGGAAVAVLGLWYASRHTVVVSPDGTERVWPWMPLWLSVLGVLAVGAWTARQRSRGRGAQAIEQTLVFLVVGSIGLFLAFSALSGPLTAFQGLDDAMDKTGASLLNQGAVPWRDFMVIHGLYLDGLRANVGFAVFGDTLWGANAGVSVLVVPIAWVVQYWFAAWVSRGSPWMMTVFLAGAVGGALPPIEIRFILVPLSLILMGEAIRRRSRGWTIGFTLFLFGQAILMPETAFLVIAVFACMVGADLVRRQPGTGLWAALRGTRWFVATGGLALLVFVMLLWSAGALGRFVQYYLINGPGHAASSATPPVAVGIRDHAELAAIIVGILLTIWAVVWNLRRRGGWTPELWVAVASAGFAALYFEKVLARWDFWHVWQVFTASLPLIVYWFWRAMSAARTGIRRVPGMARWSPAVNNGVVGALAVIVVLVLATHVVAGVRASFAGRRVTGMPAASIDRVGYALPAAIDADLVRDLDTVLRAYAGDGPIFDMTNSMGYVYYLLRRHPATPVIHIDMAISPYGQRVVIDDLRRTRPPVVLFDSTVIGMPSWDGVANDVRHYLISQYVLDGWVPVLRSHGNLILVRRDLVGAVPVPALRQKPVTDNLWFSGHACDWGASPNFLPSSAAGSSQRFPVVPLGDRTVLQVSGWAVDPGTGKPAQVVLTNDGRVVATVTPSIERPDVAKEFTDGATSGFEYAGAVDPAADVVVYLIGADGHAHPLDGQTAATRATITLPDGSTMPTSTIVAGQVERLTTSVTAVGQVTLPAGTDLAGYQLATLSAGQSIGAALLAITDDIGPTSHTISARSVERHKGDLAVRVGSCLQWHGYDSSKPLYVLQQGGAPITSITLSAVAD